METTAIFSICSKNYAPYVRTLMRSVKEFEDADRFVGLADTLDGEFDPSREDFDLVKLEDLELPNPKSFAFRYDVTEFNTAIKPWVIKYLFSQGYDRVLYIDPDIKLFDRLHRIHEEFDAGAQAVLTPHLLAPVVEAEEPNDLTILRSGVYNLGFCAMRRCDQVDEFLRWWCTRLEYQCLFNRLDDGIFVDQKWMDFLPSFVDDVTVLRHPGYNVAYWNLMHRKVKNEKGRWTVNGEPLAFFHFSGVVPGNRKVFSKHQGRFTPSNLGPVKKLLFGYLDDLEDNGVFDAKKWEYAFARFSNGAKISPMMRYIFREELEPFKDDPFRHWEIFNEPDPRIPQTEKLLITRLMYRVWLERGDVQKVFPLNSLEERHGFVEWFLNVYEDELKLDECFVAPVRERFEGSGEQPEAEPDRNVESAGTRLKRWLATRFLRIVPKLRFIYRHIPPGFRQRVKHRLIRTVHVPETVLPTPDDGSFPGADRPVDVEKESDGSEESARQKIKLIGYARAEMGVGQGVRMHSRALEAIGTDFSVFPVSAAEVYRESDRSVDQHLDSERSADVNVIHVNADQTPHLAEQVPEDLLHSAYNIGYWAWELSRFPNEWRSAFDHVDEVWVPSHFVQEAVSEATDKPVVVMPHAIERNVPGVHDRAHFGLNRDAYVFLSAFDFNSFMTRKNPEAVIKAFRKAFPEGDEPVQLYLKAHGGENHPQSRAALVEMIGDDERVLLTDRVLDLDELVDLQAQSDCLVSLHRSEGFGLNIAECMALGKPVVVTDYSGNRDFVDASNGCPVRYDLIEVGEGEYPFGDGQVWADADVEHAAEWMRRLFHERELGEQLGQAARETVRETLSPEAVGRRIVTRLRELNRL